MPFLLLAILFLAVLIGPGIWVKRVLASNSAARDDLPGTGGELAEHLMQRFALTGVTLETTNVGDHYDPASRTIRLSEQNMKGKSLTAVATAAHEFGHALQHSSRYQALTARTSLVKVAVTVERIAGAAIFLIPLLVVIPGAVIYARPLIIFVVGSMFLSSLVHLITLPVEFDASFGRALPILKEGDYVNERDLKTIRRILLACALTYVSQAALGVLNIGRWIRLLRR